MNRKFFLIRLMLMDGNKRAEYLKKYTISISKEKIAIFNPIILVLNPT